MQPKTFSIVFAMPGGGLRKVRVPILMSIAPDAYGQGSAKERPLDRSDRLVRQPPTAMPTPAND